jgi:signal transduction histidine kinase
MAKNLSVTRLSHFVIGYMVLAFGWWSLHLWRQNDRLFRAETRVLELRSGLTANQLRNDEDFVRIERYWKSGRRMVVSEGIFFVVCLAFGLWVIRRSASREVALARQRRNFLLSITHELKSPIASMRLVIETLRRRELPPPQREHLLANGLKDADRLQHLVEDLLLAARLEDNWRPLAEPIDLAPLARDVADGLKIRFPHANIQLDIPENLPPLQADRPGLTAIVQNLLENAVKYSPESSPIALSAQRANGKLQLRVADQGQGIPDAEKKAVFEKFYRVGSEETRRSTGTGLGLYIVNQVVKAHGGSIQVADNQPTGTIFSIEI